MSEISKLIDEIVKQGLAALMKEHGFRKSGRDFHRRVGNDWHVLNVQGSQSNFGSGGKFTINLGVYLPAIQNLTSSPAPASAPKEYQCTIRARIRSLRPGGNDLWWEVRSSDDVGRLAQEVTVTVRDWAFGWFDAYRDPQRAAEALATQPSIESAAAALVAGDRPEALARIQRLIAARPAAAPRAREWAKAQQLEG